MTDHPVFDGLKWIVEGLYEALRTVVKMPMEALVEAINKRRTTTAVVTVHLNNGDTITRPMPMKDGVSTEAVTFGPMPEGTITHATVAYEGREVTFPIGLPSLPPIRAVPLPTLPFADWLAAVRCDPCDECGSPDVRCHLDAEDHDHLCGHCGNVMPMPK